MRLSVQLENNVLALISSHSTVTVIFFFLQVPAIYGVDTRMLTKIIRDKV